jgi:hypothetical protein
LWPEEIAADMNIIRPVLATASKLVKGNQNLTAFHITKATFLVFVNDNKQTVSAKCCMSSSDQRPVQKNNRKQDELIGFFFQLHTLVTRNSPFISVFDAKGSYRNDNEKQDG